MIKEVAFCVYPVRDMDRAVTFYRDVVGLVPAESFGDFWVEFSVGESTFGVVDGERVGLAAGSQFSLAFEVDDLATERERLRTLGVDSTDVMESPVCFTSFVTDPDGNRFALHERKRR